MKKALKWILAVGIGCSLLGVGVMAAGAAMGGARALVYLPEHHGDWMMGYSVLTDDEDFAEAPEDSVRKPEDFVRKPEDSVREPEDPVQAPDMQGDGEGSEGGASPFDLSALQGAGKEIFGTSDCPFRDSFRYDGIYSLELDSMSGMAELVELDSLSPGEVLIGRYGKEEAYQMRRDKDELILFQDERFWRDHRKDKELDYGIVIGVAPGFRLRQLDAEISEGSFTAGQIFADELSLEVKAGKAEILGGAVGALDAECRAGALSCMAAAEWEVSAECSAGKTELLLAGSQKDYDYEIDCTGGKILLNGDQEVSYSGLRDEIYVDNQSGRLVELSCEAGSMTVEYGGKADENH